MRIGLHSVDLILQDTFRGNFLTLGTQFNRILIADNDEMVLRPIRSIFYILINLKNFICDIFPYYERVDIILPHVNIPSP